MSCVLSHVVIFNRDNMRKRLVISCAPSSEIYNFFQALRYSRYLYLKVHFLDALLFFTPYSLRQVNTFKCLCLQAVNSSLLFTIIKTKCTLIYIWRKKNITPYTLTETPKKTPQRAPFYSEANTSRASAMLFVCINLSRISEAPGKLLI